MEMSKYSKNQNTVLKPIEPVTKSTCTGTRLMLLVLIDQSIDGENTVQKYVATLDQTFRASLGNVIEIVTYGQGNS